MTIDPPTERFHLPIAVIADDIDQLSHVSNIVYLRWVQEAAIAHWSAAATPAHQDAVAWVVVRHEIDYKYSARLVDRIIASTWVGIMKKNFFEWHTEILRAKDNKILARARTPWCPIGIITGKPIREGDDIRKRFSIPPPAVRKNI